MAKINCNISRTTATTIAGCFLILFNIVGVLLGIRLVRGEESCNPKTGKCDRHEVPDVIIFFSSMMMMACCVGVVLFIIMVIGIFKKSHELMAPGVYFGIVGLIGSGIFWFFGIISCIFIAPSLKSLEYLLPCCFSTEGLQYALWFPVYSLYMELKEKANATQNTQPREP